MRRSATLRHFELLALISLIIPYFTLKLKGKYDINNVVARVAELVDAQVSKTCDSNIMSVRLRPRAFLYEYATIIIEAFGEKVFWRLEEGNESTYF